MDPLWTSDTSPAETDLDEAWRAARTVCANASDVADARELIAALGLAPALPAIERERGKQRRESASGSDGDA